MKKVFKVKEKDSILQEYEEIRKELGKAKYEALNKYLATHKNILLSDVYYNENEWNKFDAWFRNGMKDCESTAVVDSSNYVIYKSGSDIMGTNEDNYNTRIQNAREIQNFTRQGFSNVQEVVEYVKKYFKVPGKIIVKDGGITERLEEANEIIKENLEDSISEQEALAQIVKADKRFSDPRTQIKYVGKAKTTTGKEMDKYVVGIKGGPIQYNAYFWENGKLNYISTAPKGTINDAEDFITYFTNKSFSSAGNFLDYVHYKFGDYKWSNNSDGSMNVVVNGKRYRVTFDYSNTTDPDAKCKIKSIKAVDRKSVKDADPTYRSVWMKVKEYVKNHYNFNYKNDFRGLMDFLNNQYGGSIDEDKVYDILRDLNGKGYIIFVKDSKLKDAHIYLFAKSDINRSDIEEAKKYGLEVLGTNRNGSEVNLVMRGDLANLKKYAKEYLDYVLHPGYLYRENEFAGKITRDEEIKNTDKAPNSSMVNELKRKVEEFKRRGYDEEDLKITVDGNKVWFTGELSYSTHEKLANELDKIVAKYDKDAYFDAETSGRWVAHFFDNKTTDAKTFRNQKEFEEYAIKNFGKGQVHQNESDVTGDSYIYVTPKGTIYYTIKENGTIETDIKDSKLKDSHNYNIKEKQQITVIAPYDDADYYWAKFEYDMPNGELWSVINSNHRVEKKITVKNTNQIISELEKYNANIKPRIVKDSKVKDDEVYHITKEQWNKIPNAYKGKTPDGKRTVFAAFVYPNGGTTLLTEGAHFVIDSKIKDDLKYKVGSWLQVDHDCEKLQKWHNAPFWKIEDIIDKEKKFYLISAKNLKQVISERDIDKMMTVTDAKLKDYESNVNKSSAYKIIEKFPNGYGVAQTPDDGLFYVFDKTGKVLYGSYAFRSNAVEAAKNMKDAKLKDTWKHIENYKDVEIYRDDDTGDYGFSHNKGKRLYNTHSKSLEKAKKIIEKDLEFLGLDAKMKDYQSYVGFAGAEKLKQDIKNYNGNPAVFSYFLKPKQASSIELMGAIINKQEFFLTMVMKTATYKGDLAGAKKDALRAVDEITKTWKSLSYEDSAIKDGKYVINNMNDLKRLFTNFPKGDVDISYGRSGFYYHIRPKADGKVSLGSAGYDGTFNTLKEALEWVVYDFRDLILNVNPDGSDRDSAIKDNKTYKVTHKDKSYKVKAKSKRDAALIVARKVK